MELSLMKHKTLENTPEITCVSRQLKIMFYFGFFLDGVSPNGKTWPQKILTCCLISFHFVSCEARDSQKSELNHYTSQDFNGEKTRKEFFSLDQWLKNKNLESTDLFLNLSW